MLISTYWYDYVIYGKAEKNTPEHTVTNIAGLVRNLEPLHPTMAEMKEYNNEKQTFEPVVLLRTSSKDQVR